jgi:hypothetical protein
LLFLLVVPSRSTKNLSIAFRTTSAGFCGSIYRVEIAEIRSHMTEKADRRTRQVAVAHATRFTPSGTCPVMR